MSEAKDRKLDLLGKKVTALKDSVRDARLARLELQYFSLENNDDALAYFDHLDLEDPWHYIADKLLETNERKGDNPLVPYEGMSGDFKINKLKGLNHKWILADVSDGRGIDFTLIDHLLYTRSD